MMDIHALQLLGRLRESPTPRRGSKAQARRRQEIAADLEVNGILEPSR
jgi:hypothetical protein